MRRTAVAVALATLGLSIAAAGTAPTADAEPTTTTTYPRAAASTHFTGYAFDACAAPSLATMTAWTGSPYRAVGVYAGGENRTCAQPNLTADWVNSVSGLGWKLLPVYIGRQAPCTNRAKAARITPSQAGRQGIDAATDAIASVTSLGMAPGSAIYFDMENYDSNDVSCRNTVLTFLSGYTRELHRRGYLAGVYGNLGSLAAHLTAGYTSPSYARPDVLWVARWDNSPALAGWKGVPDAYWGTHQRAKQSAGAHQEIDGNVTVTLDSSYLDAPVATVARPYTVIGTTHTRTDPRVSGAAHATLTNGSPVAVLCQTSGGSWKGTKIWDKLADGNYISDHYVNTASETGYSSGVPRCYYPYQVSVQNSLTRRSRAKPSARAVGAIRTGGLAWVTCQTAGTRFGTSKVWDRVADGGYVPDYYVANPSNRTYSAPTPRC